MKKLSEFRGAADGVMCISAVSRAATLAVCGTNDDTCAGSDGGRCSHHSHQQTGSQTGEEAEHRGAADRQSQEPAAQ